MDRLFGGFGFVLKSVFGAPVGAGARFASGDAPGRFARLAGRLVALMLVGFVAAQFSPTQKAAAEVVCSNGAVVDQVWDDVALVANLATGTCELGATLPTDDYIEFKGLSVFNPENLTSETACKSNGNRSSCVTDLEVTHYSGEKYASEFSDYFAAIYNDIPSDFSDPNLTSTISYKITWDGIDYVLAIDGARSAQANPRRISYERITISGGEFSDVTPPYVEVSNDGPKPAGAAGAQLFSTGSYNADTHIESYLWEQVADANGTPLLGSPTVIFSDNSAPNQTFTIPAGLNNGDSLFFKLTLTDSVGYSASKVTEYAIGQDGTAPTYAVTRNGGNPTNASSLAFSVDFSETVQNVDAADFALAKTGKADGDTLVEVSGSGSTYTVTMKNATGSGTLGLGLSGSVDITDLSGNALNASPTANEVYDFDAVAPTFSVRRHDPNPSNASTLVFSVDFSEPVQNVNFRDFAKKHTGTVTTYDSILNIADAGDSDASTYTVTVQGVAGDGTLGLGLSSFFADIEDLTGNELVSTPTESQVYDVDNTKPTLTEVTAIASTTYDNTPDYTFNTDEAGTIAISGSCGTSSSTTVSAAGDVTLTLTQPDNTSALADGTYNDCKVTVEDEAGNVSSALTLTSFTVDNSVAPFLTFPDAPAVINTTDQLTLTLQWSEPAYNFGLSDIQVTNGNADSLASSNPSQQDTLKITPDGLGDVIITIPEGAAHDGNTSNTNAATTLTIRYDVSAPFLSTIERYQALSDVTNAGSVTFELAFSTGVSSATFTKEDLKLTYTIKNVGAGELVLVGIEPFNIVPSFQTINISPAPAPFAPITIAAGAMETFDVTFTPNSDGGLSFDLVIESSDNLKDPFDLKVIRMRA